ncbi:CHAT domain-containing protein [Symbioplanes lichenis]|uniref:CHAT domain-containing protein n=1 Tax=Symbioplanes lichenis TaxID=1629072 RepID=UPI002739C69D|nr:CHAT domain-containing protein [Actinoplanes lichenis]
MLEGLRATAVARAAVRAFEQGELRRAADRLRKAEQLFAAAPDSAGRRGDLGRVQHLFGLIHLEEGDFDSALDAFARAEELLGHDARNSVEYGRAMLDTAVALSRLGLGDGAVAYLDRAEQSLGDRPEWRERISDLRRAAQPARRPVVASAAGGPAPDGFSRVRRAAEHFATRDVAKFVAALGMLGDPRRRGERFPQWCDDASARAVAAAASTRDPGLCADAYLHRAGYLLGSGDLAGARDHALRAVAWGDEHAVRTESSLARRLTAAGSEAAREIALVTACRHGDAALAAELIECARLQALGTTVRTVTVDGVSRLGPLRPAAGAPLELRELIDRTGGPGAWWWGAWAFNERIYWSVLADGVADCGLLEAGDDTDLGRLLQELLETASCRTEEAVSAELGRLLVPPVLLRALRRRGRRTDPLSLVLSGTLFAALPVASLGAEPVSPDRFPARLIESAVLRLGPPAVLAEHVARHPTFPAPDLPVSLACVDPTGDLPHARQAPPETAAVLGGATEQSLREALARLGPSHPSLFSFAGHAGAGLDAGLQLRNGELTATRLFTDPCPFPARALLTASTTTGDPGTGAGEWSALAAAVLWSGARQVIATNWPIPDTPFAASFAATLTQALHHTTDAAAAVRTAQLEALAHWRAGDPEAHPLTWSAYAAHGVRW